MWFGPGAAYSNMSAILYLDNQEFHRDGMLFIFASQFIEALLTWVFIW